jgi:acyl-coenzyme A thioesterase PaaI-like protein
MQGLRGRTPVTHSGRSENSTSTEGDVRYQLAAAIRRISAVTVTFPLSDDEMAQAAEQLLGIAQVLEDSAPATPRVRTLLNLAGRDGNFRHILPTSPIIGFANPIAPPVEVWTVAGEDGNPEIRGRVTYNHLYEGPPNCVHGGVVAELFDELMGIAIVVAEKPAMTGTLTVRYRKPTPLLVPLDLVGRFVSSDGRKVHAWSAIYHEGVLVAEAEGLFIEGRRAPATPVGDPVLD